MNILHYALGFPPYRSGGLTKFCIDLMIQQSKEGHVVSMLWPGRMKIISRKTIIKRHSNYKSDDKNIQSFEVVNPLPVPLDEGIARIEPFVEDSGEDVYEVFLDDLRPDVIHVHTLMGLHNSFLKVAKKRKIRMVFTAHDFFPICPKVTMFRHGAVCLNAHNYSACCECNSTALSLNKIRILQSSFYRYLKDTFIVEKFRKNHRARYLSEAPSSCAQKVEVISQDYENLRNYYYMLLKTFDCIHYNSSETKRIYESFFYLPDSCVVSITHADIKDNRRIKDYSGKIIRIRYLGPQGGAKGFFLLRTALDKLWKKRQDFCLDVHFTPKESRPYIKTHKQYSYDDLGKIFDETDVLVVPSIWYETFGFTVLEALSYGVPVVVSGNVGAKEILVEKGGIIIEDMTSSNLCEELQELTMAKLKAMNVTICASQRIISITEMTKQLEGRCYRC